MGWGKRAQVLDQVSVDQLLVCQDDSVSSTQGEELQREGAQVVHPVKFGHANESTRVRAVLVYEALR